MQMQLFAEEIDVKQLRWVLISTLELNDLDENEVDELLHEFDKNNDGFIDYAEFQSMLQYS